LTYTHAPFQGRVNREHIMASVKIGRKPGGGSCRRS
jgi:hypothetical protein